MVKKIANATKAWIASWGKICFTYITEEGLVFQSVRNDSEIKSMGNHKRNAND